MSQLAGRVIETALGAELSEHLGYPPGQAPPGGAGNHRNGSTPKTVQTDLGPVEVRTPRDRQGSFEPRLVGKRQTRLAGLDDRVLDLYKPQPAGRYQDYYDQITTYVRILSHEAQAIDLSATAATFAPVETTDEESVFYYLDSASSRAGIMMATAKLEQLGRVAIVGVGGTGSYVLDLVAKTPVGEIHIFDGDELLNHNAFRAPGALSLDELRARPLKVEHFAAVYGRMRRNVIPHPYGLDETNADELAGMDFVFMCMDGGPDKQAVVRALELDGIPFIDVGMGIYEQDASIGGILRVTLSTPAQRNHDRIAFGGDDDANEYAQNIQIADLNAANAALAVIRWKRLFGFYHDFENEHHSTYTIDGNDLQNEDQP